MVSNPAATDGRMPVPDPLRAARVAGRVLLFALLFGYFFALRRYSGYDMGTEWVDADVGQRAAHAVRVLDGALPYRDFWAPYSPLPYYVNAALFGLFGVHLSSFRLALAFVGATGAFLTFVLTRRVASRTAALMVTSSAWVPITMAISSLSFAT